jgi:hypothetical protein
MEDTGRTILPPISTLAAGMPIISLDFMKITKSEQQREEESKKKEEIKEEPGQIRPEKPVLKGKQMTFTALEDLSILKAMRLYLGKNVSFKIPWSFWQLYRRSTGSQRSDSSLYHHWNGAMAKKYSSFIKEGKIDECIKWAESALDMQSLKRQHPIAQEQPGVRALIHTRSHQVVPPSYFKLDEKNDKEQPQSRQLAHFQSMQNCDKYFNL